MTMLHDTASAPGPLDARGGGARPALVLALGGLLLAGLAYPAAGVGLARLLAPDTVDAQPVLVDGRVIGARDVAQPFVDPRYLRPRPSAAGYDPRAAAGSNLAPSHPDLRARAEADAAAWAERTGEAAGGQPVEWLSASGSGLDPHLSPDAARRQAAAIARARGMPEAAVRGIIDAHVEGPWLGIFGGARVNVLAVNIALDEAQAAR